MRASRPVSGFGCTSKPVRPWKRFTGRTWTRTWPSWPTISSRRRRAATPARRSATPARPGSVPLACWLRRCEVLALRFCDVQVAGRRLAVVEGKGGHHRIVPAANRFLEELGACLHHERPAAAGTDRVFVVLKGPRRGMPLSAEGLDEILDGARRRAGLEHATCHQLRHTPGT